VQPVTFISGTLTVSGTSDVFGPGVTITISKGNQTVGTAVVQPNGNWSFTKNRDITFVRGETINIVSSSGGKLPNVPVSVR
jgi:uncharacterized protein YlxW (UPF0749 family)